MQIYFLQPFLIIFTRSAINSDHNCTYYSNKMVDYGIRSCSLRARSCIQKQLGAALLNRMK